MACPESCQLFLDWMKILWFWKQSSSWYDTYTGLLIASSTVNSIQHSLLSLEQGEPSPPVQQGSVQVTTPPISTNIAIATDRKTMAPRTRQITVDLYPRLSILLLLTIIDRNLFQGFKGIFISLSSSLEVAYSSSFICIWNYNIQRVMIEEERQQWGSGQYEREVRLKVVMQPKSLELTAPLQWQVNKIKCILCDIIPKLEFGMVRLDHDGMEIPGHLTLGQVLEKDRDKQCRSRPEYILHFHRIQNKPKQFNKYYASKMLPLFTSMKMSPFQPLLHPKYYELHTQLVQTQEITGQNLKSNLRSLMNLRNLVNNQHQNQGGNQGNNQNNNGEVEEGGFGILGPRPNGGGNIFQRGGFWVFKLIQLVIIWQLVQFVIDNISIEHIFVILFIFFVYTCIDYFQKRRNRVEQRNQGQEGRARQEEKEREEEGDHGEEEEQEEREKQNEDEKLEQRAKKLRQIAKKLLPMLKLSCILMQSTVSFIMSLFPNWNIQLHLNIFNGWFEKVDQCIDILQGRDEQNSEEEEREEEDGEGLKEEEGSAEADDEDGDYEDCSDSGEEEGGGQSQTGQKQKHE